MAGSLHIICTSSVPQGIRGALNQWYLELLPGFFVARVRSRVREEIWSLIVDALISDDDAYAVSVHSGETEQGFILRQVGDHPYQVEDFDGLQLVARRHKEAPAGLFGVLSTNSGEANSIIAGQ